MLADTHKETRARAVFLDRDGVINRKAADDQYVTCWEEFEFLPGVVESITLLNKAGFSVVVVTNQRCVAKGMITKVELERMHQRMSEFLWRAGASVDAIYYCPHDVEPSCDCRKPAPGMLLQAARLHNIDVSASWIIGDSAIDMCAGRNAGCKTARVLSAKETEASNAALNMVPDEADIVASSLLDATQQILHSEGFATDLFTPDITTSEATLT